jgi:hypothetical protein
MMYVTAPAALRVGQHVQERLILVGQAETNKLIDLCCANKCSYVHVFKVESLYPLDYVTLAFWSNKSCTTASLCLF